MWTNLHREMSKTEKKELASKLGDVEREKNNAIEKIDIVTKVVEAVNNKNSKEPKTKKDKKNIKCRDVSKANGCM